MGELGGSTWQDHTQGDCTLCGGSLTSECPGECRLCGALACPYCRSAVLLSHGASVGGCEHLLSVSRSDEPEAHNDFFAFPVEPPHVGAGDDAEPEDEEREWSDEQKLAAFGDLRPLLVAYEDWEGLRRPPWEYLLFVECVERLSVPIEDFDWGDRRFHFAEDGQAARREITEIIKRLAEGFERLAMMEPEG